MSVGFGGAEAKFPKGSLKFGVGSGMAELIRKGAVKPLADDKDAGRDKSQRERIRNRWLVS